VTLRLMSDRELKRSWQSRDCRYRSEPVDPITCGSPEGQVAQGRRDDGSRISNARGEVQGASRGLGNIPRSLCDTDTSCSYRARGVPIYYGGLVWL
jgi:hypothetical protein